MKKLISFFLAALLISNAFAQEVKSKEGHSEKKSSDKNVREDLKSNTLDGRSFKVTFAETKAEVKPVLQTGVTATDTKSLDKPVSDYSVFDANSKVMFTFSDGKILSPILADEGCAYKVNTSGKEMYAFSSYCRMNTGNKAANKDVSASDTKMKIDAANTEEPADMVNAPVIAPTDETKNHLPPGVTKSDNANLNTPQPGTTPPSMSGEEIQRQVEPPVKNQPGSMATISGVVDGNAIHGTLSWVEVDGKKMSYSFSGSAATKKDMNDSQVVGMK